MNMLKINLGTITTVLLSMVLAACGGGSSSSSNPATAPAISTTVTLATTTPLVVKAGRGVITWSSENSTSCSSLPVGVTGTSGSLTTDPLLANTTYAVTCVGPTGNASKSLTLHITSAEIITASKTCADESIRGGGKVYYYCDCGQGAESDCKPGDDSALVNSAETPQRTIAHAAARFSTLAVNDTVALCKGGAFNSAGGHNIGSTTARCAAGGTCNDLREYTPPPSIFVGTAKPIINISGGSDKSLFRFYASGGVRLLNLKLKGDVDDSTSHNFGVIAISGAQDVTMCNLDIDGFAIAVYSESSLGNNRNIKLTGSNISNSRNQGFLGGADNLQINYNHWEGNASHQVYSHAIYFSSNNTSVSNMQVIGNYVHGQYGNTCRGTVIVGHVAVDGFRFENNTVDIDAAAATGTCFGIGFSIDSGNTPLYIRNARFLNNTVKNGGSSAFSVGECPDCLIENNLIIQDWPSPWQVFGMYFAADGKRAGDDVSDRVTIKNNTVWFGPQHTAGGYGIVIGAQGTGHIIANNTVTYTATTAHDDGFSCYSYPLAPGSYTAINNNHCHTTVSSLPFEWEKGSGNLAAWKGSGFDLNSITGDPKFTAPGTDFKPASLSPLIGSGNTTYGFSYIGAFAP